MASNSLSPLLRSLVLPLKNSNLLIPLNEIQAIVPSKGKIYDLGCGEGFYATTLAQIRTREVIGIDNDTKKIKKSSQTNLKFLNRNIITYRVIGASAVLLIDVLHHLNRQDQNTILKNIYQDLRKGGLLIIKEIDAGEFLRSKLSRFWDFLFFPTDKIYYSRTNELSKKLNTLGFSVKAKKVCRLFPGSTTLIICKKL